MTDRHIISSILAGLSMLISLSASAQDSVVAGSSESDQTVMDVAQRYAPGTITSTEIAGRALEEVKRQRASVESQFARDEAICYKKFFATSCMDTAKDRRRMALKQLNAIEVEANARKRRAGVEEKDQALRERQAKQEANAAEKADTLNSRAQNEAPATAKDVAEVESRSQQAVPASESGKNQNAEGVAHQETEFEQARVQDRTEAKKRAENIKAYEKKQQRSLERQREIEAKKQEKEQKQQQEEAPEKP